VLKILFAVALTVEIHWSTIGILSEPQHTARAEEIINVSKAIALGDFSQKAIVFSKDEIGTLAVSINNMADELSKAENKFRKLLESAPDAMVIVNRAGVIRLVNAQTEKMFQYTREEMIGQPVEILIPGDFARHHSAHRDGYFKDPKVRTMGIGLELYGKRKNGEEFPVEIQPQSAGDRGGDVGIICHTRYHR
jgi:PAS domain S-box-containing protein